MSVEKSKQVSFNRTPLAEYWLKVCSWWKNDCVFVHHNRTKHAKTERKKKTSLASLLLSSLLKTTKSNNNKKKSGGIPHQWYKKTAITSSHKPGGILAKTAKQDWDEERWEFTSVAFKLEQRAYSPKEPPSRKASTTGVWFKGFAPAQGSQVLCGMSRKKPSSNDWAGRLRKIKLISNLFYLGFGFLAPGNCGGWKLSKRRRARPQDPGPEPE